MESIAIIAGDFGLRGLRLGEVVRRNSVSEGKRQGSQKTFTCVRDIAICLNLSLGLPAVFCRAIGLSLVETWFREFVEIKTESSISDRLKPLFRFRRRSYIYKPSHFAKRDTECLVCE